MKLAFEAAYRLIEAEPPTGVRFRNLSRIFDQVREPLFNDGGLTILVGSSLVSMSAQGLGCVQSIARWSHTIQRGGGR